jgi:putative acetyltransferase
MLDVIIRPLHPEDNSALALVIRQTLAEFGANHPNTVYYDPSTDHLFELFSAAPGSRYYVAEKAGRVLGGAGIYPTDGLPQGTCELVKMYLLPEARGLGLGRHLIDQVLREAKELGYTQVYLESMPELTKAVGIYEKFGFNSLLGPMGNSGHTGCAIWMLKQL